MQTSQARHISSARKRPSQRTRRYLPCTASRLDARDLKILEIIQTNGRISKKALADAIGLSLTPCFQRLRRLEKAGFIRGYRGVIDARRLGAFLWIYVEIRLSRHRAPDLARFESAIREVPEAIECDAVGGGVDYFVRLVARDIVHYQRIIEELLARDVGVEKYFTYIVTKRVKDPQAIPIAALLEPSLGDSRKASGAPGGNERVKGKHLEAAGG